MNFVSDFLEPWITSTVIAIFSGGAGANQGGGYLNDFMAREFWRFVLVQQRVAALAATAIEFPPMQAPASFNLETVKRNIEQKLKQYEGE